jgi:acetyl-CoA synthetase
MSRYKINNLEEYFKEYKNQFVSHESSGTKLLRKLHLVPRMGKVVDFNMAEANIKWFVDAKVNITKIVLTDTLPKATKPIILNRTTLAKKQHTYFLY